MGRSRKNCSTLFGDSSICSKSTTEKGRRHSAAVLSGLKVSVSGSSLPAFPPYSRLRIQSIGQLRVGRLHYRTHRGSANPCDEGLFRPDRPSSTLVSLERLIPLRLRESKSTSPYSSHRRAQWPTIQTPRHLGRNGPLSCGFRTFQQHSTNECPLLAGGGMRYFVWMGPDDGRSVEAVRRLNLQCPSSRTRVSS